jgi:hypothetical protein
MLRAFLLLWLLGDDSIPKFADTLQHTPRAWQASLVSTPTRSLRGASAPSSMIYLLLG